MRSKFLALVAMIAAALAPAFAFAAPLPYVTVPPATVNASINTLVASINSNLPPAWNTPVVGGGSVKTIVFCDSISWKVH